MLNSRMSKLLNEQLQKEFESAYLYLEISGYYSNQGLEGFANWFLVQAKEEEDHAMKIYNYLLGAEEKVDLRTIVLIKIQYSSLQDPLEQAIQHEKFITNNIDRIYTEAEQLKDYRSKNFLEWFISEQAEEEMQANALLTAFKNFGNSEAGLYELNHQLGKRRRLIDD